MSSFSSDETTFDTYITLWTTTLGLKSGELRIEVSLQKKKQLFQLCKVSKVLCSLWKKKNPKNLHFQISIRLFSKNYRTMSDITMTNTCMRMCNTSGASLFTIYTPQRTADVSVSGQLVFMDVDFCCMFESTRCRAAHLPWQLNAHWPQPPVTFRSV